jgi:hypothetical protein
MRDRKSVSESEVHERETFTHWLTMDTDSLSREVSNKLYFSTNDKKTGVYALISVRKTRVFLTVKKICFFTVKKIFFAHCEKFLTFLKYRIN